VRPGLETIARWRYRRRQSRLLGARLLAAFAKSHPAATFIEIGANDGRQHDHLRDYVGALPWTGLMVEPVPYVFDRLAANYGGVDGVTLVNAAVAERDGRLPFFHLREASLQERAGLPDWYDGVGSLRRDVIESHAPQMPDIGERIVQSEVEALTFDTLLERHGLGHVDLLLIDAEGHDAEILRSIDLGRHRPRLVVYEHFHLSPSERAAARARIEAHGYGTVEEMFDTYCLVPGPGDALDRAWKRFEPALPGVSKHDEPRT
jgi:FkbM family methyltransferase